MDLDSRVVSNPMLDEGRIDNAYRPGVVAGLASVPSRRWLRTEPLKVRTELANVRLRGTQSLRQLRLQRWLMRAAARFPSTSSASALWVAA